MHSLRRNPCSKGRLATPSAKTRFNGSRPAARRTLRKANARARRKATNDSRHSQNPGAIRTFRIGDGQRLPISVTMI